MTTSSLYEHATKRGVSPGVRVCVLCVDCVDIRR